MAWRPSEQLIEGELDNTIRGKVTGWMKFAGKKDRVEFNLTGEFHRDIRGAKVRLTGQGVLRKGEMQGFASLQTGRVGDMTAGLPPRDYVSTPYFEWYSEENGRVVIELDAENIEILTPPIPWIESDPIDRREQEKLMQGFIQKMGDALGAQPLQVPPPDATARSETERMIDEFLHDVQNDLDHPLDESE